MEEKSKAEKRAAGRLLLQKYQKKTKDGKSSPSPKNNSNHHNDAAQELVQDKKSTEQVLVKNGHTEECSASKSAQESNQLGLFTFQKDDSPAEQFFDSFRPSSQQSSPEHSDKIEVQDTSLVSSYNAKNASDRLMDDKTYECSSSSSRSEEDAVKRLMEGHVGGDSKEEFEKKFLESNEKVVLYENEMKKMKQEIEHLRNQQTPLEEEILIHLKTIQIIVSEKSELQQQLTELKEVLNKDRNKFEELNARLKASQEKVDSLGGELSETYEAREQHNTILKKLEHSLADSIATAELHRKEVIDAKEEINLLKQRLELSVNQVQETKKLVDEKDKQLSMAEMRLAQVGAGGIPTKSDVNKVEDLEKECSRLHEEITKLAKEKSDIVSQYKQYIDTLNSQVQLVNQQYESCLISKNQLLTREESLVKHISDLEKKVQKEHQAGPALSETNAKLTQELKVTNAKITELNSSLNEKEEEISRLNAALDETSSKLGEAELALERLEVPDARKLQAAMESDRVAATRAVQQNNQLKQDVVELQEAVVRLNNEKLDLTEKWQHSEYIISELNRQLKKYKGKEDIELRDAVAQCTVIFYTDGWCQADIDDLEIPTTIDHVTPESVGLLERKLKKTMNDYANLYDEKQRLEHLVLHLQSETETIGEYVTLYQNQRCLLQERAKERDRQMAAVSKEREELKLKLAQISSLLPQVIQESGSSLVEPSTVPNGDGSEEAPTSKIKTLLSEIETSSLMTDTNHGIQSNFHPCLLCSGKLITI